ncbi:MAG TPA: CrcB family protein [Halanaerobiales bacterium]|nr:CrcB family protein [Halanaerobiales bacterium]
MQFLYLAIIFLISGLIRYYFSKLIYNKLSEKISYGSLILNIIVCFTIGFFMVYLSRENINYYSIENINNYLITVFIAFSASSYKAVHFLKNKMLIKASTNIFYNLFLGLVFLTLGNLIAQ